MNKPLTIITSLILGVVLGIGLCCLYQKSYPVTSTTSEVEMTAATQVVDGKDSLISIPSPDGRYTAFYSMQEKFVLPGKTSYEPVLYVHDRTTDTTVAVSNQQNQARPTDNTPAWLIYDAPQFQSLIWSGDSQNLIWAGRDSGFPVDAFLFSYDVAARSSILLATPGASFTGEPVANPAHTLVAWTENLATRTDLSEEDKQKLQLIYTPFNAVDGHYTIIDDQQHPGGKKIADVAFSADGTSLDYTLDGIAQHYTQLSTARNSR